MKTVSQISRRTGMELFDVKPVVLGGNPNDPANKVWLTREQHFVAVRYWNKIVRQFRST